MARMMFGHLVLLAASVSPVTPPPATVAKPVVQSGPAVRATATATARIRIVSGVKFGPGYPAATDGAERRKARLTDATGAIFSAELLEFQ